jgi:hypothetical protein
MDYQIVCRNTEHPHSHIVDVGTGDESGWSRIWTIAEVLSAMGTGDRFHTISPTTGERAEVHPYTCNIQGCQITTLRSDEDLTEDNNLDNLSTCAV